MDLLNRDASPPVVLMSKYDRESGPTMDPFPL